MSKYEKVLLILVILLAIATAYMYARDKFADYTMTDSQARAYCGFTDSQY